MWSRLLPPYVKVSLFLLLLSVGTNFAFLAPQFIESNTKFLRKQNEQYSVCIDSLTSSLNIYNKEIQKRSSIKVRVSGQNNENTSAYGKEEKDIRVDIDLIRKTADLSQLDLSDEECEKLTTRVQDFLQFVDAMRTVEIKNKGSVHENHTDAYGDAVPMENIVRLNEVKLCENQDSIMENMPLEEDGYLRIPKVGEESTT